MELKITHANEQKDEIRYIQEYEKYDVQIYIGDTADLMDNTWQLIMPSQEWEKQPILEGHFVYINNTEYGGRVDEIVHSTEYDQITLTGTTWRGILMSKIIEPPKGEAYKVVSGEATVILNDVAVPHLQGLFICENKTLGILVKGQWRYLQMHNAIQKAFRTAGLVLAMDYINTNKTVNLYPRIVQDRSEEIEFSQDYDVAIQATIGKVDRYNHIIALGAGELLDRDIVHLYRLDDGTITTKAPSWVGTIKDIVTVYDYTSAESVEELIIGATKRLQEFAPVNSIEMDIGEEDGEIPLGDIVGARDRVTGLATKATIIKKILTITGADGVRIETKVE